MTPVYQAPIWIPVIAVFVFMFVMNEVGYRLGKSRDADEPERSRPVTGTLKTTVMGLVALLLGFTYAMASNRFDYRQRLGGRRSQCHRDLRPSSRAPPRWNNRRSPGFEPR